MNKPFLSRPAFRAFIPRLACSLALMLLVAMPARAALVRPTDLLKDPSREDWAALSQYDGTLTREQFQSRLSSVFDPFGGLSPFLKVTDGDVTIYSSPNHQTRLARITFASSPSAVHAVRGGFRPPQSFARKSFAPLSGLRIVIEPADIGGSWGPMEDRSSYYKGYGLIQEGDLNLTVSRLLRARLKKLGADVFVTRDAAEPVSGLRLSDVLPVAPAVLAQRPYILPVAFHSRARNVSQRSPAYQKIAAEVLLTKNLEARARAQKARLALQPDLTVVLQFDATPASCHARLADTNRNIFFVEGAYTAKELSCDARQRLKLLTKLLQNVTPAETMAATAVARQFQRSTGYPPVLYGNSPTTRAIASTPYVVARNLALSREHDGPVIVTEPYFMNQPVTLSRLLAGDYNGSRLVAGKLRPSIYREYADTVVNGLLAAYGKGQRVN